VAAIAALMVSGNDAIGRIDGYARAWDLRSLHESRSDARSPQPAYQGHVLGLEFEDLILVLALAALMNLLAHFVSGNAHVFGMPLNIFMEFIVPALAVPCLILFKYGRPRGISPTLHVRFFAPKRGARLSEILS